MTYMNKQERKWEDPGSDFSAKLDEAFSTTTNWRSISGAAAQGGGNM